MKKAKEHASELLAVYAEAIRRDNWGLFTEKLKAVSREVAIDEVQEMRKARTISLDTGTVYNLLTILIPIYKSQRAKYGVICKIVNGAHANSMAIKDFDEVVKAVNPKLYKSQGAKYGVICNIAEKIKNEKSKRTRFGTISSLR